MKKHDDLTLDEVMQKITELGGDISKIVLSPELRKWVEAKAEAQAPIIAEESRIRNERWAAEIRERQMAKGEK